MKVKLTRLSRKDKVSKAGKPFVSLGIRTEEHGERWLSGFGSADNKDWKAGDEVEIEVVESGEYLNFTTAKKDRSPAIKDGATSEIMNALRLKVIPALEQIQRDMISLDERLSVLAQRANLTSEDELPTPDFG